jgi:DNA-binding GntR family transcriptional regulator
VLTLARSTRHAARVEVRAEPRQKGELFGADQRVYESVRDAVMAQRLPPGTKLVESALSEALGVPRAVVRMGLLRLAHDRIVELRPNRGAAVACPTLEDARNVYDARRLIEGAIAERLCGKLTRAQLAELRRLVTDGEGAYRRDDTAAWITLAGRFQIRLAEFTNNPVIVEHVRDNVGRSNLITALYLKPGSTVFAGDDRRELLALLADGAPGAPRRARLAMERLLRGVEDRLQVQPPPPEAVDLRSIFFVRSPEGTSSPTG